MNLQDLLFMLSGAGIVLTCIPALFLLREKMLSSKILASALLVVIANILHAMVVSPHNSNAILLEPLQFALPPLFAAYVRALFQPDWQARRRDLRHFLPFMLVGSSAILLLGTPIGAPANIIISLASWSLLLVQALVYVGRALGQIRQYRLALKAEKSNLVGIDPVWLVRYSFSLHVLYLGYLLIPAIVLHTSDLVYARYGISLIMCLAIGYLAIHQLLASRPPVLALSAQPADRSPSYDPELPAALRGAMEERRLYREPELDLNGLAMAVGWPRNEVSAAINAHFHCNFYDFVNAYRVAEAKLLLDDPTKHHLTLLALGLQAGFNSKPTFNAVFKKQTGLSPSAWQKRSNWSDPTPSDALISSRQ